MSEYVHDKLAGWDVKGFKENAGRLTLSKKT